MKSIKKNYIYNLTYQILALMAPLITTPYVSRVLGAEAIGEYSYAYSIVYYFMLAAILGTATYAEREISFVRMIEQNEVPDFGICFFLGILHLLLVLLFMA